MFPLTEFLLTISNQLNTNTCYRELTRYVPASNWFERLRNRRTAEAHYLHNLQVIGLYRLPQELFNIIAKHLGDSDCLCLEASYRRPTMGDASNSPSAKSLFRDRFYEDNFERATVLEATIGTERLKMLFCSACRKHHPRCSFTAAHINASGPHAVMSWYIWCSPPSVSMWTLLSAGCAIMAYFRRRPASMESCVIMRNVNPPWGLLHLYCILRTSTPLTAATRFRDTFVCLM
jgi:hypothetical protein